MEKSSLVVVGTGIKFMSHLTTEAKAYIEQSEKVLYLVNEPVMQKWLQQNNNNAESLDFLYTKYPLRKDCYREITNYIVSEVEKNQHVCVVLYGHPAVFAVPALDAVIQARKGGYDARVLPGVSAEDCLFADLLIDPGSCGCQSYEATDFLIRQRSFSSSSHLILWQVGMIGNLGHSKNHNNQVGIQLLAEKLRVHYPSSHQVMLYEAALYPGFKPRDERVSLEQLPFVTLSKITTLYIPPSYNSLVNENILQQLGINKEDLRL